MKTEYVAIATFINESAGMFYEEGGIYNHRPRRKECEGARALTTAERTVDCPRCGQRFADTDKNTAEANRDLHFDGDEDCPSICRAFPDRRSGLITILERT